MLYLHILKIAYPLCMLTIQLPSLIRTGPPPTILTCLWTKHEVFVPPSVKRNEKTKWGVTQKFIRKQKKHTNAQMSFWNNLSNVIWSKRISAGNLHSLMTQERYDYLFVADCYAEGSPKEEGNRKKAYFCSKQWIGMRNEKKDVVTSDGCLEYHLSESVWGLQHRTSLGAACGTS